MESQYAPYPDNTAAGVRKSILRSSHGDQLFAYLRSMRTISSKVRWLRPFTCHSPVIPGLTSKTLRRCQV